MSPAAAALTALLLQQLMFALTWAVLARAGMAARAARPWAIGVTVVTVGVVLLVLRSETPAWMGRWASVSVIYAGFLVMIGGLRSFCRVPPMPHGPLRWVAVSLLLLGADLWPGVPRWVFVSVSSLVLAELVLRAAWTVRWQLAEEFGRRVARASALPFAVIGVLLALRALAAPLAPTHVGDSLHLGGGMNLVVSLAFAVCGLMLNLALMALVAGRLVQRLHRASEHDPLTGLLNRRGFDARLHQQLRLAARHGHRLSLLSIDADHFKRINDRHGHAAGDAALQELARVLAGELRDSDEVARVGGEEFWVLLPETDTAGALELARRVLAAVRKLQVPLPGSQQSLNLTVSIGVASSLRADEPVQALMQRLDRALYRAKAAGRDRVEWAEDTAPAANTEAKDTAAAD